jgi:hypothetical protein
LTQGVCLGRAALKGAAFFFGVGAVSAGIRLRQRRSFRWLAPGGDRLGRERGFDARHLLLKRFRLLALQRIDPSRPDRC